MNLNDFWVNTQVAFENASDKIKEKIGDNPRKNITRKVLSKHPLTKKGLENQLSYEEYQEKSRDLIISTKGYMKRIDSNLNQELRSFKKNRTEIRDGLFKRAAEITSKIKVKEFEDNIKLKSLRYDLEKYAPENELLNGKKISIPELVGPAVWPISNIFIENLKTKKQVRAASVEYDRVKAECQRQKARYASRKATTKALENTNFVIESLSELLKKSEDAVEQIINSKGKLADTWSDEDISTVRTMFNLLGVLSDILHADPFTKNGNLTTTYKRLIGDAKEEFIGESNE